MIEMEISQLFRNCKLAYSRLFTQNTLLIHAQAQTKAQAWKVVHYFW